MGFELTTSVIIGTGSCKSNYLMISNPMDPGYIVRALLI